MERCPSTANKVSFFRLLLLLYIPFKLVFKRLELKLKLHIKRQPVLYLYSQLIPYFYDVHQPLPPWIPSGKASFMINFLTSPKKKDPNATLVNTFRDSLYPVALGSVRSIGFRSEFALCVCLCVCGGEVG